MKPKVTIGVRSGNDFATLKPKVTIGMCGKNCAGIVGAALESVAKQDFPHELMELVFVDDGSTDITLKVVKNYLSQMDIGARIFSEHWQGLGKARNIVIYNALAEYVLWVDADEILTSDYVQKQIKVIDLNPRAGIVTGEMSILENENLVVVLDLIPYIVEYSRQEWKSGSKFPGTGGTTYRVVAAKQVGGFNEEITRVGEDMEIAQRIKGAGWLILKGDGVFYERDGPLSTLIDLLRKQFNYGIQCRHLYRKTSRFISLSRMNPFASVIAGVLYALQGYRLTGRKVALFLLPPHFSIKMLAWFYGFCKG